VNEWRLPYEKLRKGVRPGDIIAYHRSGIFPTGIAIYEYFKTGTPIESCMTHVSVCVSGPTILDRKLIIEAAEGEVNVRALSSSIHAHNGRAFWYPLREELRYFRAGMDIICWNKIGTKYDFGGVVANVLGNVSIDLRKLFCSELAQLALQIIPYELISEIIRNRRKEWKDFPVLKLFYAKKALRPNQLVQLPFFKPRIEIL